MFICLFLFLINIFFKKSLGQSDSRDLETLPNTRPTDERGIQQQQPQSIRTSSEIPQSVTITTTNNPDNNKTEVASG